MESSKEPDPTDSSNSFSSLPLDVIYLVLRKVEDRRTLLSAILSCRSWLDAFNNHKDPLLRRVRLGEITPFWKDAVTVAAGNRDLSQGLRPGEKEIHPFVGMKFVREYNRWYGTDVPPSWATVTRQVEDDMIENHAAVTAVTKWYCSYEITRRQGMLRTKAEGLKKNGEDGAEEAEKDAEVYIPETPAEVERVTKALYRDWLFHIFFRDHSSHKFQIGDPTAWSYLGQPLDADMQVQFVCYTFWEFEAMYAAHRMLFLALKGISCEEVAKKLDGPGFKAFNLSDDEDEPEDEDKDKPKPDGYDSNDEYSFVENIDEDFVRHCIMVVLGYRGLREIMRLCAAARERDPEKYPQHPTAFFTTPEVVDYVTSAFNKTRYRTGYGANLYQVMEWYPRFNRMKDDPATDDKSHTTTCHVVPYPPYVNPLSRVADPIRIIKPSASERFLEKATYSSRERYAKTRRAMFDEYNWSDRGSGGYEDFEWPENADLDRGACFWDDWRLKRWGYLMPVEDEGPPREYETWNGDPEPEMSEGEEIEREIILAGAFEKLTI